MLQYTNWVLTFWYTTLKNWSQWCNKVTGKHRYICWSLSPCSMYMPGCFPLSQIHFPAAIPFVHYYVVTLAIWVFGCGNFFLLFLSSEPCCFSWWNPAAMLASPDAQEEHTPSIDGDDSKDFSKSLLRALYTFLAVYHVRNDHILLLSFTSCNCCCSPYLQICGRIWADNSIHTTRIIWDASVGVLAALFHCL